MQVSARNLGRDYGLTAEEMNRVLFKLGFYKGQPGDYSPTEKALPYVVEKEFHRGTGGYSLYNRYWITRSFDDSIKEVLDVSDELISEVREELAMARAARYAAQAAARAKADAEFLAKQAAEKAAQEVRKIAAQKREQLIAKRKKAGKIGLIVGGVIICGYSISKVAPKVKAWWNERKNISKEKDEEKYKEDKQWVGCQRTFWERKSI